MPRTEAPHRHATLLYDSRIILITAFLTVGNLATCLHRSSRVYLYQQSQCLNYYRMADPTVINSDNVSVEEMKCKGGEIQSSLSLVEGGDAFLTLLPVNEVLLVLAMYQKLLPIVGLRRIVLVNLTCQSVMVILSTFFFKLHRSWAVPAMMSTFIFDIIGGGDVVRMIVCVTVISAIAPPESLAKTFNYITSLYLLASVLASSIGSALLSHHVYILNGLSVLSFVLAIGMAIFIPPDLGRNASTEYTRLEESPSTHMMSSEGGDDDASSDLSIDLSKEAASADKTPIPHLIFGSLTLSFRTFLAIPFTPNPTFTVLAIFCLNSFAVRSEILLPQYISLSLHWPLATVNAALAAKALVSAIVVFLLPTLRTRYLEPRLSSKQTDLFVITTSIVAGMVGMAGFGFTGLPAPFFVGNLLVYTCGIGVTDSLTVLGTMTLPAGMGKDEFFVRIALVQTGAGLIGSPLWSVVFAMGVKNGVLPVGLPFWVSAGLFGVALVAARVLGRYK